MRQQKDWDVFCPHCATEHKLADENELRINFEDKVAYFNCKSCKRVMGYNLGVNPELVINLIKECCLHENTTKSKPL